jgi:Flp pilus assembly pilin Flp
MGGQRRGMGIFKRLSNDKGQTVIEYVLVAVLIVMVIVLAFQSADVGQAISNAANAIENQITETE